MKRSKGYQMNIQLLNFLWKYPNVCWGNNKGFFTFSNISMRSLFLFRHFVAAILFLSLRFLITSGSSSFILWNTKRRSHKLRVCMKMVLRNVEWKIANNHIVKFITGNYSWAPVKFCQSGAQSLKNNVFPTRENNELLEKFFFSL